MSTDTDIDFLAYHEGRLTSEQAEQIRLLLLESNALSVEYQEFLHVLDLTNHLSAATPTLDTDLSAGILAQIDAYPTHGVASGSPEQRSKSSSRKLRIPLIGLYPGRVATASLSLATIAAVLATQVQQAEHVSERKEIAPTAPEATLNPSKEPAIETSPLDEASKNTSPAIDTTPETYGDLITAYRQDLAQGKRERDQAAANHSRNVRELYLSNAGPLPLESLGEQQPQTWERDDAARNASWTKSVAEEPLSTFSVDVDTASYANVRRYLSSNQLPPSASVRIEEMINYFTYQYPIPAGTEPFSVTSETMTTPWNSKTSLLLVGLQGKAIQTAELPASHLVFLIDVSGSMSSAERLPLLQQSLHLLVERLRPQDKVSIVTYAGHAGVALEPTSGEEKAKITSVINQLQAGGSTAGSEGIRTAYEIARRHFAKGGNNRVILATDGDFNVGVTDDTELVALIEKERESGVYLSVLGFGTDGFQDRKMEQLANKGNGNFAYIDSLLEAKKALSTEFASTLFTIAKDVKVQVEFNPAAVRSYRLLGYQNRMLAKEDFTDDTVDAGEVGSGHQVTALYEIVLANEPGPVEELRYSERSTPPSSANTKDELALIKLRYKLPNESTSKRIEKVVSSIPPVVYSEQLLPTPSNNLLFASAVAEFGMMLSEPGGGSPAALQSIISRARQGRGEDETGLRAEFIRLVEKAYLLVNTTESSGSVNPGVRAPGLNNF